MAAAHPTAFSTMWTAPARLIFSTYYGGSGADRITWAGFGDDQRIFIGGVSDSTDLPLPAGATDVNAGGTDGFYGALTVSAIRADGITVGKDLAASAYARLGDSKNYIGVPLTITSADPASVLLASRADEPGQATLTTSLRAAFADLSGRSFLVYCLTGSASVPLTLSAPGYPARTMTVRCVPSALYVGTEIAVHSDGSGVATGDPQCLYRGLRSRHRPVAAGAESARRHGRGSRGCREFQHRSSDPRSKLDHLRRVLPLVVGPNVYSVPTLRFSTHALGSADLVLSTNSGFPFAPSNRVRVRSTGPALTLYIPPLAKDMVDVLYANFTPAPKSAPTVTLTSSDPAKLRITLDSYQSGSAAASTPCDSFGCRIYAEVLDSSGPVSITLSAPGSDPVTFPVALNDAAAGFYDANPRPLISWAMPSSGSPLNAYIRINANPSATLSIASPVPKLRAGARPLTVNVTNSDSTVAAAGETSFTILPGQDLLLGPISIAPKKDGNTLFSLSFGSTAVIPKINPLAVQVYGTQWTLGPLTVGKDLQAALAVTIPGPYTSTPPPLTIASADPSRLLFSTDPLQPGQASLTVRSESNYSTIYVQALAGSGDVEVTASIPGGVSGKGTVHLVPSGFAWTAESITTALNQSPATAIVAYALDPANLAPLASQLPRGGLDGAIALHNSNAATAAVAPDTISIAALSQAPATTPGASVKITPLAPGDTQIDFVQPPGFVAPAGRHGLRIKVAKPAIVLPNLLVGRNMQTSFSPTFTGRTPTRLHCRP